MTIKETMIAMYNDGVYGAAMLRDGDKAREAIEQTENYYKENPTDPWADVPVMFPLPESEPKLTYEEGLAKELHGKLYKVALAAWCRGYTREQMLQLLNLLAGGEAGVMYTHIRICDGGEDESIDSLRRAWNDSNPDAAPIMRADPDIG